MNGLLATRGWIWWASKLANFNAPIQPMTITRPYRLRTLAIASMVDRLRTRSMSGRFVWVVISSPLGVDGLSIAATIWAGVLNVSLSFLLRSRAYRGCSLLDGPARSR